MRLPAILLAFSLCLAAQPAKDRHVILVSLDGFAAYALQDRSLPLPNLRRLAAQGAAAQAMQVVNPSVTWPNHTSMVTGVLPAKHSVLYNGQAVRKDGVPVRVEPWVDKKEMVTAETLYDVAYKAGLTTAEIDWVAILNPGTITWSFAERAVPGGQLVNEMVAAGEITEADIRDFARQNIVWRDEIWTRAAEFLIGKHKPNLLLFHLLATDSNQHSYGASSLGARTALALADARVGRLIDAVKRAGIEKSTTFFIVSDHGFRTYRHQIRPNALLRQKGLIRGDAASLQTDAWVVPEGGSAMVYVTNPAKRAELVPQLRSLLASLPGVHAVYGSEDFDRLGLPQPSANPRMADLVLAAEEGYAFNGDSEGGPVTDVPKGSTPGAHGYMASTPEMNGIFIVSGAGIREGVSLGNVRNLDIAPTAAALLNITMQNVDGKVLREALR